MNVSHRYLGRVLAFAVLTVGGPMLSHASAQTRASGGATLKLKTVTTDDKTASVGVPDGWMFVRGGNGYIYVTGPNDERINLGAIIAVKNGPAGPGSGGPDVAFALPFGASMKEKFTRTVETGAAQTGAPKPNVTFTSETPTKLRMCARFTGTVMYGQDSKVFEGVLCSLHPDWTGIYKNIVFLLDAPSSRAAEARPIVEQIAASFRLTPAMFQRMIAPYTPLPPTPPGGPGAAMPAVPAYWDPTLSATCFDYNILRESPPWEVPMKCGGTNPYIR